MLVVIGAIIAAGVGVTVLVGSSIREFTRDIPVYRARINAEVLPVLEWLSAKGMNVPTSEYMSHFEPGAAVQLVADLLNGFGRGARQRVPDLPHRGVHPVRNGELPAQVQRRVR